jgi:hypothetical protein
MTSKISVGDKFGVRTVIKVESKKLSPSDTSTKRVITVECECGNISECGVSNLRPTKSCRECALIKHGHSQTKEYQLHRTAKDRAKKQGLPFDLAYTDIIIPDVCPLLNIPIKQTRGSFCDNSPTLDRIIPALGYTKKNVWVISNLANRIKTNATPEQIITVGQNLLCLNNLSEEP